MKTSNLVPILLAMTLLLLTFSQAFAQPNSYWYRTFGGVEEDICHSVHQTADGGYILAGTTESFGVGHDDFWLVKTDANGDSLWSHSFGGGGRDICTYVQQTSDSGYMLTGYTESFGAGGWDFWLVKTNENGDSLWSRTYGGSSRDMCASAQQTSDNGFILAGHTTSFGTGDRAFWLVKTNSDGDSLWSRTYGGMYWEECESIRQTSDGGYVLAGYTGVWDGDFWIVKTTANGDSLWSRRFRDDSMEGCQSVWQTSDGGYILAGDIGWYPHVDILLVKMDMNGDTIWWSIFGGSGDQVCHSVQQTSDGGYILAGLTGHTYIYPPYDVWLIKVDANGDSVWSRTFGGTSSDGAYSIQQTADSGYIVAGWTYSYGAGGGDFWVIKTGPELAAEPHTLSLPTEYALHQNFPNPFNPTTRISYYLPKTGNATLTIYDLLGREIATLVDGVQTAGNHSILFDGASLPSGIYFYRLQTESFTTTKKMVLLK